MQTNLTPEFLATADGQIADKILRACVHCGFCNATCPTYQILGDELDGPRGRIYLMKQVFEGEMPSARSLKHLDRCLQCLSCETTCPSGVKYGELLTIGRSIVEQNTGRPFLDRLQRAAIKRILPYRRRFAALIGIARLIRPLLPLALKKRIPTKVRGNTHAPKPHTRRMVLLEGCVQPILNPNIDNAARKVFDAVGIELRKQHRCCGALSYHLGDHTSAKQFIRANIDEAQAQLDNGAEYLTSTASGCLAFMKTWGDVMADDPAYADAARIISAHIKDPCEILGTPESITQLKKLNGGTKQIALQSPCTLTHALKLKPVLETLLRDLGFDLRPVADSHLCCGSAGTYSLLQPELSNKLRTQKIASLNNSGAEIILSANIGCISHLQGNCETPLLHWLEYLAAELPESKTSR